MAWSIRHDFVEDVTSRHENNSKWVSVVSERNSTVTTCAWPYIPESAVDKAQQTSTLFSKDELSNLEVEHELEDSRGEEYHYCR